MTAPTSHADAPAPHADAIAAAALSAFAALHRKYQPRPTEWVPLAGVVLETHGKY